MGNGIDRALEHGVAYKLDVASLQHSSIFQRVVARTSFCFERGHRHILRAFA